MRLIIFSVLGTGFGIFAVLAFYGAPFEIAKVGLLAIAVLIALAIRDVLQKKRTILRNFPIIGNFRYLFEMIRPEINQYFVESDTDGKPLTRQQRSVVYQRAKGQLDTVPFGTKQDYYQVGYEWINHSLSAKHLHTSLDKLRVKLGSSQCQKPYDASILNISAMSYGALSKTAISALNQGAKLGNFAHNTGEGGISDHHLQGGDIIWQIGTGYFGCRDPKGEFSKEKFQENAQRAEVKAIEIKLSQGAKPGHGGILPAAKISDEIARIRGVSKEHDVVSPPAHSAFSTPLGLMEFLGSLRESSGGKPVGFKLCIGKRREFLGICKAIKATGIFPDFIAIDGGEGGTGAAPLEFTDRIGCPLTESVIFARNCLVGFDLKHEIKLVVSGKIMNGFGIIKHLAIGADMIYSARAMMLALGCIQALRCNSNDCPTGVATQKRSLYNGLHVPDKAKRVYQFHRQTLISAGEILASMGLDHPSGLKPSHIFKRTDIGAIHHYGQIHHFLEAGCLNGSSVPDEYAKALKYSSESSF